MLSMKRSTLMEVRTTTSLRSSKESKTNWLPKSWLQRKRRTWLMREMLWERLSIQWLVNFLAHKLNLELFLWDKSVNNWKINSMIFMTKRNQLVISTLKLNRNMLQSTRSSTKKEMTGKISKKARRLNSIRQEKTSKRRKLKERTILMLRLTNSETVLMIFGMSLEIRIESTESNRDSSIILIGWQDKRTLWSEEMKERKRIKSMKRRESRIQLLNPKSIPLISRVVKFWSNIARDSIQRNNKKRFKFKRSSVLMKSRRSYQKTVNGRKRKE